jgi:proteasome accessory factor B
MKVRKAERLLNLIVLLLDTARPLTVHEIRETVPGYAQEQWDSFKRMFERDKEVLREMGIPLELGATDAWEAEEGYRIPKERYELPDLNLSDEELAALCLAAGLLRLQDPEAAQVALLKLAGDLSPELEAARPRWLAADLGLAVPGLPKAFEAVAERKRLAFSYRSSKDGRTAPRTLDPYGLVHRRGSWYLVGRDHRSGEIRSFRLDRVVGQIHFLDPSSPGGEFEPQEGFRPEEALEAPPFVASNGAGIEAVVRFEASSAWWIERTQPWLRLEAAGGGAALARVGVSDPVGFISWVLSLGEGAEVVEPPQLRGLVRQRLEEACG